MQSSPALTPPPGNPRFPLLDAMRALAALAVLLTHASGITGFNTDIEHDGVIYHVQTEDKGLDSPIILSLVYAGGTILAVSLLVIVALDLLQRKVARRG